MSLFYEIEIEDILQIFDNGEKYEPEYFKEPVIEWVIGLIVSSSDCMAFYIATELFVFIEGIGNFGILDNKGSMSSLSLYSIPKGDWFDHISSAHYTAEIIIYFSFVILTKGFNLTIWLTFIWTIVCLGIIAKNSEK
ncbi:26241_t:CDS:2 [Dentiscutata erythropus]|uniref:26241_t:CDS:1 n=1 Tax=Dentiscutata erythropus TaxID=1348616 RepID=A0A9N8ZZC3_9GLOM|nr:26241_t:CDS:2 [Dentiscutata erythropus]